jgi:hypothetical protein
MSYFTALLQLFYVKIAFPRQSLMTYDQLFINEVKTGT